jgi:Na+-transporting methylmalonyl-CoA/oxaloacetate decarboxylase gamma subunit
MHPIPLIATTTGDFAHSHSVMDALPHLGGMLMVLITLVILWGLTALLSRIVAIINPKPPAVFGIQPEDKTVAVPAPVIDSGVAPELVALIAAAVAASTGKSRIISIKPMSTSWEKAGRQSVLTSHRIR